ncbi:hypothetical protein SMCF_2801, partial [Streptomyces coelicoflavus ZG0656]
SPRPATTCISSSPSDGWANLKGRSTGERARALIALAAPEFRDGLTAEARRQGLI